MGENVDMSFNGEVQPRDLPRLNDLYNHENVVISRIRTLRVGGNVINILSTEKGDCQVSTTAAENWKIDKMKEVLRNNGTGTVTIYFHIGHRGRFIFEAPRRKEQ